MEMTDVLSQYIIDDPALEGQNIDAFKIRFDSYTKVFKDTKRKAKKLSAEGRYMEAAALYKEAGEILKKTANEIMRLEDNQVSLVIGHIVAVVKDIARAYAGDAALPAVGNAIVHASAHVPNQAISDALFNMGDTAQLKDPYLGKFKKVIYPISISITTMMRLYESYSRNKKRSKTPTSTNPIRKEASTALYNMARKMYNYADREKRKKFVAEQKAKRKAMKEAAKNT